MSNLVFVVKGVPDLCAQPLVCASVPAQVKQERAQRCGRSIESCGSVTVRYETQFPST